MKITRAFEQAIYFYKLALNLATIPSEWASSQKNIGMSYRKIARISNNLPAVLDSLKQAYIYYIAAA